MRHADASRRAFMLGACCTGWGVTAGAPGAFAAIDPSVMTPTLAPNFKPVDTDEKGFWQAVKDIEEDIKRSNFLLHDEKLNSYISGLCCNLAKDFCPDMRVYIVRTPYFNASMYSTGMMQVWTGLLLRMKSEAQLAVCLVMKSVIICVVTRSRNIAAFARKPAAMRFLPRHWRLQPEDLAIW